MEHDFKSIYDELEDITDWLKLTPGEMQYLRYPTNIVLAAIKITDIYNTVHIARANLHFLDNKDFGDYAKGEKAIRFVKSMHIQNSLIFYNIAVNYSWQVLWLYYNDALNEFRPTAKLYESAIKDCNYEELLLGLTLKRDYKMRDHIVKPFFQKATSYNKIRPMYNYLKHRGSFHFEGLGMNRTHMMFGFYLNKEKINLPMVSRKEMDVEYTKQMLLQFDKDFVAYMSYLIELLIPKDFTNGSLPLDKMLTFMTNKYAGTP